MTSDRDRPVGPLDCSLGELLDDPAGAPLPDSDDRGATAAVLEALLEALARDPAPHRANPIIAYTRRLPEPGRIQAHRMLMGGVVSVGEDVIGAVVAASAYSAIRTSLWKAADGRGERIAEQFAPHLTLRADPETAVSDLEAHQANGHARRWITERRDRIRSARSRGKVLEARRLTEELGAACQKAEIRDPAVTDELLAHHPDLAHDPDVVANIAFTDEQADRFWRSFRAVVDGFLASGAASHPTDVSEGGDGPDREAFWAALQAAEALIDREAVGPDRWPTRIIEEGLAAALIEGHLPLEGPDPDLETPEPLAESPERAEHHAQCVWTALGGFLLRDAPEGVYRRFRAALQDTPHNCFHLLAALSDPDRRRRLVARSTHHGVGWILTFVRHGQLFEAPLSLLRAVHEHYPYDGELYRHLLMALQMTDGLDEHRFQVDLLTACIRNGDADVVADQLPEVDEEVLERLDRSMLEAFLVVDHPRARRQAFRQLGELDDRTGRTGGGR